MRGGLLQKRRGELLDPEVGRRRRRRRRGRVTGSLCGEGVGADVELSNGWKHGDSQQGLLLCDLRIKPR